MTGKYLVTLAIFAAAPAAAQTQAQMNRQSGSDFDRADAAMNAQYRQTMTAMKKMDSYKAPDAGPGPSYQAALLAAQRAWLAYRDAECLVEGYEFRGGSAQGMAAAQCRTTLTKARTQQLKIEMWPQP